MKQLILLVLIVFIYSCSPNDNSHIIEATNDNIYLGGGIRYDISIVKYQGCEYIILDEDSRTFTHKGNCSNQIHSLKSN